GRAPAGDGEVRLGRSLARSLGVGVGDEVDIEFPVAAEERPPYEVVGIGVAGSALIDASPGSSVLVDPGEIQADDDFEIAQVLLVRYADDADPDEVLAAIRAIYPDSTLAAPILPRTVQTVGSLSGLPLVLAGLVALLAIGVAVNALFSSVRLGRHQIGILKALGCTRRQVAGVVAWQATGWALGAVLLGLPLGLLLASVGWKTVQRSLGVEVALSVPWASGALGAVAVLVLLNAVALLPSHRAASVPPAEALRTE
ncbi:MAG: FtsX-like permease family protein, partial [Acidimicrobiales bacterium]